MRLKLKMLDGSEPITILVFLSAFQMNYGTHGVHRGTEIRLLEFSTKIPPALLSKHVYGYLVQALPINNISRRPKVRS